MNDDKRAQGQTTRHPTELWFAKKHLARNYVHKNSINFRAATFLRLFGRAYDRCIRWCKLHKVDMEDERAERSRQIRPDAQLTKLTDKKLFRLSPSKTADGKKEATSLALISLLPMMMEFGGDSNGGYFLLGPESKFTHPQIESVIWRYLVGILKSERRFRWELKGFCSFIFRRRYVSIHSTKMSWMNGFISGCGRKKTFICFHWFNATGTYVCEVHLENKILQFKEVKNCVV